MGAIRVYVADDRDLVRAGIRSVAARAPEFDVVGEAVRCDEALRGILDLDPDVVILGHPFDPAGDRSLCRALAEMTLRQRVIALVQRLTESAVRNAALAGAHGVLLTDLTAHELRRAIRAVARGSRYVDPRAASWGGGWIDDRRALLKPVEVEILQHASEGRTNVEIGGALALSPHTVNARLRSIYAKLGVGRRVEAVAVASRMGLLPYRRLVGEPLTGEVALGAS